MLDRLLLLSGNDIPFFGAGIAVRQPTLKDIALIGEKTFFSACEFLRFSKENLNEEDKKGLENQTNFDVLMSILKEKNPSILKHKSNILLLLSLLFPECSITINNSFILKKENQEYVINNENYTEFLNIINEIFCLGSANGKEYNPLGPAAKKIAEKLEKARKARQNKSDSSDNESIFDRYCSILAVGENKDLNFLMNYTIYQLLDEFKRFQLKLGYDMYIQAKMAGAKDLEEVDDWMKDIYSDD